MAEWFEEWFGEEYLELYPHRDEADAERMVRLIERTVAPSAGATVLDVCCGAGRHAVAFARAGFTPVGTDLSRHLLLRARATAGIPVVRADVRDLPFRARSVDLAVNLFTSFGYFETDAEHLLALRQMIAPIRPRGWFVIDFLDADRVRRSLAPAETTTMGGVAVTVERWLHDEGRFVIKTITPPDGRQFMERVRLYSREELVAMLSAAGARVRYQFGDYDGGPIAAPAASRVILFAQTG